MFITHYHPDHTLGLQPFLINRVIVDRHTLTFLRPTNIKEHLERLWEVSWGPDWKRVMRPQFKVRYLAAKASGTAAGIRYETVKLDHGTMGSNGYRLHIDGKIVAYSGDTESTAPLDKLVDQADIAIVEATGPGDVFSHMSWENAAKLKKRHPNTRFLFNHLYSGTVSGAVEDLQVIEV
jgi:ribonuclease BN (tRNA processing enzyme)